VEVTQKPKILSTAAFVQMQPSVKYRTNPLRAAEKRTGGDDKRAVNIGEWIEVKLFLLYCCT